MAHAPLGQRRAPVTGFYRRYTEANVLLVAHTDALHDTPSGLAAKRLYQRKSPRIPVLVRAASCCGASYRVDDFESEDAMQEIDSNLGATPAPEAGIGDAVLRTRVDPRTGEVMQVRPASFWRAHDTRRRAEGRGPRKPFRARGLVQPWTS